MATEKKRILMLFHILSMSEGYARAFELAEKSGVTERTIKSDMKDLEAFAKASGAQLLSKKGKGYILNIINPQVYNPVKDQLAIQFMYKNDSKVSRDRTNDILRRIIVEENYLTIDDIADELYLTRSSIKEEMKQVSETLKTYNLSFRKKNEIGYLVKGSEFNRRMLMLSLFEVHYHEAITLYKCTDFTEFFERTEVERYDIRHIFLKTIRESNCYVSDEQKISRYLCLMSARYHEGYPIEMSKEDIRWIKSFEQFKIATDVIDNLNKNYHDFEVPENEICALALLFLFLDNIPKQCDIKNAYKLIYGEVNDFIDSFVYEIRNDYGINIDEINDYKRILNTAFIPIFVQKRFHAVSYRNQNAHLADHQLRSGPFSVDLSYVAARLFKDKYNQHLSLTNVLIIAERMRVILAQINFSYKPIRAIVTTQNGFDASYSLKRSIAGRFGSHFEKIDVYGYYEMRKLKREDYDYVLLSLPYFTYKYDWPCLLVDDIPTRQQMDDIYNLVILKGVELEKISEALNIKNIGIYSDFDYENYESFIKLISFKIGNSCESISQIESDLLYSSYTCCHKKVCILFIKRKYTNSEIFDIYHLKQTKLWRDKEINDIAIISVNYNENLEVVRFIDNLTYQLFNNSDNIGAIIDKNDKETLVEIVRDSLKALPISPK